MGQSRSSQNQAEECKETWEGESIMKYSKSELQVCHQNRQDKSGGPLGLTWKEKTHEGWWCWMTFTQSRSLHTEF